MQIPSYETGACKLQISITDTIQGRIICNEDSESGNDVPSQHLKDFRDTLLLNDYARII